MVITINNKIFNIFFCYCTKVFRGSNGRVVESAGSITLGDPRLILPRKVPLLEKGNPREM